MTGISLSRVGDPPYKSADITSPRSSTDDPEPPGSKVSSNYTRIVREKGPIKEIFVVDHRIQLHEHLLPPLNEAERSAEGGRSNLFVKTKSGKVDVDIFIATDSPSPKPNRKHRTSSFATVTKKINLVVESERGDVIVRLHAPSLGSRPPIHLSVKAKNGSIFVLLPRSVTRGTVDVTANKEPVVINGQLSSVTNIISEEGKVRRLVIGKVTEWDKGQKDDFCLASGRRVYLQYEDEELAKPEQVEQCIVS